MMSQNELAEHSLALSTQQIAIFTLSLFRYALDHGSKTTKMSKTSNRQK